MNSNLTSILFEERFYLRIGSTWFTDSINLFVTAPIGLIGFFLNIISFVVLTKIKVSTTKLYDYMKIYSLNSALICALGASVFISFSPRYFPYHIEYFALFGRCIIDQFLLTSLYLFANIMDIIIAFERVSIFNSTFQRIDAYLRPILISILSIMISLLINTPLLFIFYIRSKEEIIMEANFNFNNFTLCGETDTLKGYISSSTSLLMLIVLKDIFTLSLEIVASLSTIYYYQRYRLKSRDMIHNHHFINETIEVQLNKKDETGRRLSLMTIWMSILSITSHFILFIVYISPLLINNFFLSNSYFILFHLSTLFICLKHFSNFFLFYFFNLNFKNSIIKNE